VIERLTLSRSLSGGVLLLIAFTGCAAPPSPSTGVSDQVGMPSTAPQSSLEERPPFTRAEEEHPAAPITVETGHGLQRIFVTERDGRVLYEGDIEIPQKPNGAAVFGNRWYQRTIPYEVDASFPHASRITDAMAHWQKHTAMRFTPRTNESDYVVFVPGRGCSASVGRIGGLQNVTLMAGENIQSVVGADFSPLPAANGGAGRAHFWFRDGLYTVGRSWDVDETQIAAEYTLPAGKTTSLVRDMAFAANGDVYTWYGDGTVSVGTPASLGAKAAPAAFALPAGESASSVIGVAFTGAGHVRAWYADGTTSEGTPYDLGAYATAVPFTLASGHSVSDVLAVGVWGDVAYAWYKDKQASGGSMTSLAATYAPYAVTTPGHCGVPEIIHEIGHAVGFQHEQTRSDRDQYITIQWSNISSASAYNFQMHDAASQDVGAYDYASIMHYESYAFSTNGQPTILRKDGGLIGYATVLSAGDITATGLMYP